MTAAPQVAASSGRRRPRRVEALRLDSGAQCGRFRGSAGRSRRPDGRERRRQIDPRQRAGRRGRRRTKASWRSTGVAYAPASPREAIAAGIVAIHQATDRAGAPGLTVAETLLLDRFADGRSGFFVSPRSIRRRAADDRRARRLLAAARPRFRRHRPRRAAACRHRPRALGRRARADLRRADREPVVDRSRAAVRRHRGASPRKGPGDRLHLPPNAGSAAAGEPRRGAARRPGRRRLPAADRFFRRRSRR